MFITPIRVPTLKTVEEFRRALEKLGLELPCDDQPLTAGSGSPLAGAFTAGKLKIGNRWCIHPMEGWDGTPGGQPSEHTLRRWKNFGLSGAKLLWGGEAFAVRPDGRANPRQLCYRPENVPVSARCTRQQSRLISRISDLARRMIWWSGSS